MNGQHDNRRLDDDENNTCDGSKGRPFAKQEINGDAKSSSNVSRDPHASIPDGHNDGGMHSESAIPLELQNRKGESNDVESTSNSQSISSSPPRPDNEVQAAAQISHELPAVRQDQQVEEASAQDKSKKDRSKLRKGKWTVEEEEYTSRIIQHFSTGLLVLPDGATLRSYLADKLNCDPMRITKKFTGACCLGRRVYHLREKPRGSPAEIEMAKAELLHLERRFRMRVEQEQSGLPLSRQQEMLLAQPSTAPTQLYPINGVGAGVGSSAWVPNFPAAGIALNAAAQNFARATQSPLGSLVGSSTGQWLLPATTAPDFNTQTTPSQMTRPLPDQSLFLLNNLVNSWAWSQTSASLRPSLLSVGGTAGGSPASSPLALAQVDQLGRQTNEDHQRLLRETFEEHKREELKRSDKASEAEPKRHSKLTSGIKENEKPHISPAEQLQKSYEQHLRSLNRQEQKEASVCESSHDNTLSVSRTSTIVGSPSKESCFPGSEDKANSKTTKVEQDATNKPINCFVNTYENMPYENKPNPKTSTLQNDNPTAEEEAGTILLGFLNSLRRSYEDAVDVTEQNETRNMQKQTAVATKSAPESSVMSSRESSIAKESKEQEIAQRAKVKMTNGKRTGTLSKKRNLDGISPSSIQMSEQGAPFRTTHPTPRSGRPASVTDTSTLSRSETSSGASNPTESSSSLEDSDSKSDKTDGSSSEESEKECHMNVSSKGPPRKRLKSRKFTKRNLMAHSNRLKQASNESMKNDGF